MTAYFINRAKLEVKETKTHNEKLCIQQSLQFNNVKFNKELYLQRLMKLLEEEKM